MLKREAAKLTGDREMPSEGKIDKAKGSAHSAAGDVNDAARKIRDALKDWSQLLSVRSPTAGVTGLLPLLQLLRHPTRGRRRHFNRGDFFLATNSSCSANRAGIRNALATFLPAQEGFAHPAVASCPAAADRLADRVFTITISVRH